MRKDQQLINFHGTNQAKLENAVASSSSTLSLGEIAVLHRTEDAMLAIKDANEKLHYFLESGTTVEMIEAAKGDLTVLSGMVVAFSAATVAEFNSFSAAVVNNYATSADTVAAIEAAKGDLTVLSGKVVELSAATVDGLKDASAATLYVESKLKDFSGAVITNYATSADTVAAIEAAKGDLTVLSGKVVELSAATVAEFNSFSAAVVNNYATSADTVAAIEAAKGDLTVLSGKVVELSAATVDGLKDASAATLYVESKLKDFSGAVITNYATSADTVAAIEAAKGDLTVLSGKVVELSAATVAEFNSFSAAVVNNYATSADTVAAIEAAKGNLTVLSGKVVELSAATVDGLKDASAATLYVESKLKDFSGAVITNYATSADTVAAIEAAKGDLTVLSGKVVELSAATVAEFNSFSAAVVNNYATSANTVAAIEAVNDDLKELSAATEAFSASVVTELKKQTIKITDASGNTGVTISSDGNTYTMYQGDNVVGRFNILKDSFVRDGRVETSGDSTYLVLDIKCEDGSGATITKQVKIDVSTLVDAGAIAELSGKVMTLSAATVEGFKDASAATVYVENKLKDFSGAVITNYATSADTVAAIEAAKGDLTVLSGKVVELSAATVAEFNSFSAAVVNNYATSADTVAAIEAAKGDLTVLSGKVVELSAATVDGLKDASAATLYVESKLKDFSGAVITNYATSADTVAAIEAAKGDLTVLSGKVVELSAATVAEFNSFSAAVVNNYATSADTVAAIEAVNDDLKELSAATIAFSAATVAEFNSFSAGVIATYATSADTVAAIEAIKQDSITALTINGISATVEDNKATLEINASAITLGADVELEEGDTATTIAGASASILAALQALAHEVGDNEKVVAAALVDLDSRISGITSNVAELSAATEAFSAATVTELAKKLEEVKLDTVTAADYTQSGVKVDNNGTTATIDFSGLVVDCGTFDD